MIKSDKSEETERTFKNVIRSVGLSICLSVLLKCHLQCVHEVKRHWRRGMDERRGKCQLESITKQDVRHWEHNFKQNVFWT